MIIGLVKVEISLFISVFMPISVIFQDGGQTDNVRAKGCKDIFWRPCFYLQKKSIQMAIGQVEGEISGNQDFIKFWDFCQSQ